jgi:hypothetical protein
VNPADQQKLDEAMAANPVDDALTVNPYAKTGLTVLGGVVGGPAGAAAMNGVIGAGESAQNSGQSGSAGGGVTSLEQQAAEEGKRKLLQMHLGALNMGAYRDPAAQTQMNGLGQALSAYQPAQNMLGAMYGRQGQVDTSQIMRNPMPQGMTQIGQPNRLTQAADGSYMDSFGKPMPYTVGKDAQGNPMMQPPAMPQGMGPPPQMPQGMGQQQAPGGLSMQPETPLQRFLRLMSQRQ